MIFRGQGAAARAKNAPSGQRQLTLLRDIAYHEGKIIMRDPVTENLLWDLLEWLEEKERTYEEVMDAWRTSCPKLPVWEDANDRGLVRNEQVAGRSVVRTTPRGRSLLAQARLRRP
jgi:hypothetical protein